MKKLLLVTTGGIATFALIFTMWNPFGNTDHVAIYKPRSARAHMQYDAHGAMQVQWEMKKNYFTGQIEHEDIMETRRALKRYSDKKGRDNDMEWNSLGPDNIGGRSRAIWINPENDSHLIGGGVSGGLWQSFNGGNNWEPVNSFNKHPDFYQHMMITSIARTGSGIYYIGTGSQHEYFPWSGAGTAGFVGGGVWRSTDASGENWENVFSPSPLNTQSDWITVDAIVVDPNNPEKLWIAHNRGLDIYIHGNGNEDLEDRPATLPQNALPCEDVHISKDGQVILASIGNVGYMSTDGGEIFTNFNNQTLVNGGPNILGAGQNNARIEFAIAPSDADYLYAVAVNSNQSLKGVVASFDRGETWYRIAQDVTTNPMTPFQPFGGPGGQGVWDCAIVVNPLNPKQIFIGGLIIYSHTITGNTPALANWEQRSVYSTNYINPFAVHPDIHFFVWDSNNVFYAATDGGFFRSNNMATSNLPMFFPVNQGYVTTQFYGIAHSNDDRTVGGTQDNGTLYQNQLGVSPNNGVELFGGDGFDCEISFVRPSMVIGSSQNGNVLRSLGGEFGENISPLAQSGDFTTNVRLVETENDPYSTRGTMWQVDTLYSNFVPQQEEWEDGTVTLGYVPAGTWILHHSVSDQRELWTQLEENMYYYQEGFVNDTTFFVFIDTTETIIDIELVDSVLTPIDTTYIEDCDTFNLPLDTTFIDTCNLFMGELFCVHLDTIVVYQDTLLCEITDTIVDFSTEYFYDTTYTYLTEEVEDTIITQTSSTFYGDSLLLIDPVQSLFVVGFGNGQGIYVTRDVLNTTIEPEYWNVANISGMVNCLEWSPDRNHLYVGTVNGSLTRISGFNQVYHTEDLENLTTQTLISGGAPISDIAVDYSEGTGGPDAEPASEMVVVTRMQYGTTDKVLVSMNAASATSANTFSSIWNIDAPLNRMPVYSCVIAKHDPDVIVIGTEVGIFRTNDGGDTWIEENGGMMDRVPVLDLRQQYREAWEVTNSEIIYAGTHGRGIFNNGDYFQPNTSIDDNVPGNLGDLPVLSNLTIFPNPMNTQGWVEFKLNNPEDVRVSIFTINGKMVHNIDRNNLPVGEHKLSFDAARLTAGTYILVLEAGGERETGKFIVTK